MGRLNCIVLCRSFEADADHSSFTIHGSDMAKKPLNIGLVGYGFMGRTHSNGYKRVNDFFPNWPIARC